jgi:Recombination endonuclease VII
MPYKDKRKQYENVVKWKKNNRERHLAYMKEYRAANKPSFRKALAKHIEKDPAKYKEATHLRYIRRTYGITNEEYGSLLKNQDNKCAICTREFTNNRMRHVDHNHTTGQVRGILCAGCNRSIAALDNQEWLEKAQIYLANNS